MTACGSGSGSTGRTGVRDGGRKLAPPVIESISITGTISVYVDRGYTHTQICHKYLANTPKGC